MAIAFNRPWAVTCQHWFYAMSFIIVRKKDMQQLSGNNMKLIFPRA